MAKLFDALGYYEILDVDFDADDNYKKHLYLNIVKGKDYHKYIIAH